MILLHVDGKPSPVEVASGPFAFVVVEYLALAGATEHTYNGPGRGPNNKEK